MIKDAASALLVSQGGERAQRVAEITARTAQSRFLQKIGQDATRQDAIVALNRFVDVDWPSHLKAVENLIKDRDELLASYDFLAEYLQHLRTTSLIESTFTTARHRRIRTL